MPRILEMSDEGAEAFVVAMLKNDIQNIDDELSRNNIHPEDRKCVKKARKALIKVINYYVPASERMSE